jgi:hypothetical protein
MTEKQIKRVIVLVEAALWRLEFYYPTPKCANEYIIMDRINNPKTILII